MARGRKVIDNQAILVGIKNDPVKLKQYETFIATISDNIFVVQAATDTMKYALDDAAETLGLSKAFIKKTVMSRMAGDSAQILSEAEALYDAVNLQSDNSSEEEEF